MYSLRNHFIAKIISSINLLLIHIINILFYKEILINDWFTIAIFIMWFLLIVELFSNIYTYLYIEKIYCENKYLIIIKILSFLNMFFLIYFMITLYLKKNTLPLNISIPGLVLNSTNALCLYILYLIKQNKLYYQPIV